MKYETQNNIQYTYRMQTQDSAESLEVDKSTVYVREEVEKNNQRICLLRGIPPLTNSPLLKTFQKHSQQKGRYPLGSIL